MMGPIPGSRKDPDEASAMNMPRSEVLAISATTACMIDTVLLLPALCTIRNTSRAAYFLCRASAMLLVSAQVNQEVDD